MVVCVQVASTREWVLITDTLLSLEEVTDWVVRESCGAVVTFCGTVRNSSTTGHEIVALEYETSEELATSRIGTVIREARSRWPTIEAVAVHHRVGRVERQGFVVVVAVSAPHRGEAFEAAQFCIDTVKTTVPMWKREIWDGGSVWSQEAQPIVDVEHQ